MNSNEMQNVWNSPGNTLPPKQLEQVAAQFVRQMNRRRRFQTLWLINSFVWLTIITGMAIRSVAVGHLKLAQEWGLLPLLIVPWAFALLFLRRHLNPAARTSPGELSIIESLRAAFASNHTNQLHLKLVGVLYLIVIPGLIVSMRQLQAVGKISARELISMTALFGGALFISAACITALYFGRLVPQQKQLGSLLAELTGETPN